ncbi:hypothetical protein Airi02_015000 [Actinoallomurus iriomotensis]|uniref:Uncharacterized protein n=1 Tax=Actinoallomurus iriomotensis TaxID=478107 RepID=A0A9W6VX76_9ACTN|nr:hypothetical protein Airi02_015000 [Actinoallomurus iriomotensis]
MSAVRTPLGGVPASMDIPAPGRLRPRARIRRLEKAPDPPTRTPPTTLSRSADGQKAYPASDDTHGRTSHPLGSLVAAPGAARRAAHPPGAAHPPDAAPPPVATQPLGSRPQRA